MSESKLQRVILAEDDPAVRKLVAAQLAKAGYDVLSMDNGVDALQAVREAGSGVVVADWSMPGMDGLELCRTIVNLHRMNVLGYVYFILITAHAEKEYLVRGFEAGANDFLTKPYHVQELLARVASGQRIYQLQQENWRRRLELESKNAELDVLTRRFEKLANTDALTGVHNRRRMLERFDEAWAFAQRKKFPLSCILFDIDRFKRINDTLGHAAGDAVLKATAARVARSLRVYDVFGRVGGEEFLVICPDTNTEGACVVAERIRTRLADTPIKYAEEAIPVTVSLGIAEVAERHERPDALLHEADLALYKAKENGRNQAWVARSELLLEPARPSTTALSA